MTLRPDPTINAPQRQPTETIQKTTETKHYKPIIVCIIALVMIAVALCLVYCKSKRVETSSTGLYVLEADNGWKIGWEAGNDGPWMVRLIVNNNIVEYNTDESEVLLSLDAGESYLVQLINKKGEILDSYDLETPPNTYDGSVAINGIKLQKYYIHDADMNMDSAPDQREQTEVLIEEKSGRVGGYGYFLRIKYSNQDGPVLGKCRLRWNMYEDEQDVQFDTTIESPYYSAISVSLNELIAQTDICELPIQLKITIDKDVLCEESIPVLLAIP